MMGGPDNGALTGPTPLVRTGICSTGAGAATDSLCFSTSLFAAAASFAGVMALTIGAFAITRRFIGRKILFVPGRSLIRRSLRSMLALAVTRACVFDVLRVAFGFSLAVTTFLVAAANAFRAAFASLRACRAAFLTILNAFRACLSRCFAKCASCRAALACRSAFSAFAARSRVLSADEPPGFFISTFFIAIAFPEEFPLPFPVGTGNGRGIVIRSKV
jgi:hypothetical protein